MSGGISELGAKVRFDPPAARRIILRAVAIGGTLSGAAVHLGIHERTLRRYVERLELESAVRELRGAP